MGGMRDNNVHRTGERCEEKEDPHPCKESKSMQEASHMYRLTSNNCVLTTQPAWGTWHTVTHRLHSSTRLSQRGLRKMGGKRWVLESKPTR